MDVRFRPISNWPGKRRPSHQQKNGDKVFSAGYQKTLESLGRELTHLKARDGVIEADLRDDQIRLDGWPRSGESPKTSGIVVSFTSAHGPLRIQCDYFKRYEHNLRAIALHLERLRLANNYGVGEHGEQYRGWKQLEAAGANPTISSVDAAAAFLTSQVNLPEDTADVIANAATYREFYRIVATMLHPDVNSNPHLWHVLQEAKALLDQHHGLAKAQEARG